MIYRKKNGFTLAEVLVALALIGIITALTIPTFVSSSRNKANAAKLATTITAVENAFTAIIAAEGVNDLSESSFVTTPLPTMAKYLKLANTTSGSITGYYGSASPFKSLGATKTISVSANSIFQTKNGALLFYTVSDVAPPSDSDSYPGSTGKLVIDVNGAAKPNIFGRDAFQFRVGYDGLLYPAGGKKYADMDKTEPTCTADTGQGCTARLIENNFEVDY